MHRPPTTAAAAQRLKDSAEDNVEVLAIAAPEAGVDAKDDRLISVEPKSESVVVFEVPEIEIRPLVGDFARVIEQRAVEPAPYFPAILPLRQDRVWSAESILPESSQRVVPSERGHHIKRHHRTRLGVRRRHEQSSGQHTTSRKKTHELTKVGVEAPERIPSGTTVVVAREIDAIPSTLARVLRLAIINLQKGDRSNVIDRFGEARGCRRTEKLLDRRHARILALTESRVQVLHSGASGQDLMRTDTSFRTDEVRSDRVTRLLVARRIGTNAEKILPWVVAVGRPGFDHEAFVRQLRKGQPRFRRPVALHARRHPHVERAPVLEQIPISVTGAERKAAPSRKGAHLRIEPFTADDEDGLLLDKAHPAFEPAGRVRPQAVVLFRSLQSVRLGAGGRLLGIG